MFDDILGKRIQIKNININKYNKEPFCIYCKSKNIKETKDYFTSDTILTFEMKCKDCNCKWIANMNRDLKVVEIKRKQ